MTGIKKTSRRRSNQSSLNGYGKSSPNALQGSLYQPVRFKIVFRHFEGELLIADSRTLAPSGDHQILQVMRPRRNCPRLSTSVRGRLHSWQ
jgi:hypothetical protein